MSKRMRQAKSGECNQTRVKKYLKSSDRISAGRKIKTQKVLDNWHFKAIPLSLVPQKLLRTSRKSNTFMSYQLLLLIREIAEISRRTC